MPVLLLLSFLLLSSCKAAKPELVSLLGKRDSGSQAPANSGNGRTVVGASVVSVGTFNVRSRVAETPQGTVGTSTNFRVRSNVQL